jgi:hypothetical protein
MIFIKILDIMVFTNYSVNALLVVVANSKPKRAGLGGFEMEEIEPAVMAFAEKILRKKV